MMPATCDGKMYLYTSNSGGEYFTLFYKLLLCNGRLQASSSFGMNTLHVSVASQLFLTVYFCFISPKVLYLYFYGTLMKHIFIPLIKLENSTKSK